MALSYQMGLQVGAHGGTLSNVPDPAEFNWSWQRISDEEAGRDQSGKMYVGEVATKVTIEIAWSQLTPADTASVLTAFNHEYLDFKYTDPMTNAVVTKQFYHGDMGAPVQQWMVNNKRYQKVSFKLIEV